MNMSISLATPFLTDNANDIPSETQGSDPTESDFAALLSVPILVTHPMQKRSHESSPAAPEGGAAPAEQPREICVDRPLQDKESAADVASLMPDSPLLRTKSVFAPQPTPGTVDPIKPPPNSPIGKESKPNLPPLEIVKPRRFAPILQNGPLETAEALPPKTIAQQEGKPIDRADIEGSADPVSLIAGIDLKSSSYSGPSVLTGRALFVRSINEAILKNESRAISSETVSSKNSRGASLSQFGDIVRSIGRRELSVVSGNSPAIAEVSDVDGLGLGEKPITHPTDASHSFSKNSSSDQDENVVDAAAAPRASRILSHEVTAAQMSRTQVQSVENSESQPTAATYSLLREAEDGHARSEGLDDTVATDRSLIAESLVPRELFPTGKSALSDSQVPVSKKIFTQIEPTLLALASDVRLDRERQSLKIQLHPSELGTVEISLVKNESGSVNAHIVADNESAHASLNENVEQLRSSLENAGLQIEKLEVNFRSASSPGQGEGNGGSAHGHTASNSPDVASDPVGISENDEESASRLVSLRA